MAGAGGGVFAECARESPGVNVPVCVCARVAYLCVTVLCVCASENEPACLAGQAYRFCVCCLCVTPFASSGSMLSLWVCVFVTLLVSVSLCVWASLPAPPPHQGPECHFAA